MIRGILFLMAAGLWAAPPAPDWPRVEEETLRHYQALLRIDTSDPPGHELPAVDYLKKVLEAEGIQCRIFAEDPKRPNLVARLKGSGAKRPLLLMAHTDVVNVDPAKWKFPPFSATRDGGYIYGRGTLDDKDNLVTALMTMIMLKRTQAPLDRDVIFLAESAEEGNSSAGIIFMVKNHFKEIEAEYCLAEGGSVQRREGKLSRMLVGTTEKVPAWTTLRAKGTAGHGSVPLADNAVVRISQAVARVAAWQTPMKLNDTTRAYFERLATISTPEQASRYNNLVNPSKSAEIQEYLRVNEARHYSMLRTSISPNIVKGGYRTNVIPSEAEAVLDIRALPDEDLDSFFAQLKSKIADPSIEVVRGPATRKPTSPSRLDTEMFRTLESVQKRIYRGAITMPVMQTGATDMALLRERGMQCYGIGPMIDEEDAQKGFGSHSDQERILEASLYQFLRFNWEVVTAVAVRP